KPGPSSCDLDIAPAAGHGSLVPMPARVRLADEHDAAAVSAVLAAAFDEFRILYSAGGYGATAIDASGGLARMGEGPVWIAEADGTVGGTVAAVIRAEGLYVRGMAVAPSARRNGVARLLLAEAERYGRSQGLVRAFLSTTPFLHGAIRLYRHA